MLYLNKEMSSRREVFVFLQRIETIEVSTLSNKREQIENKAHIIICPDRFFCVLYMSFAPVYSDFF